MSDKDALLTNEQKADRERALAIWGKVLDVGFADLGRKTFVEIVTHALVAAREEERQECVRQLREKAMTFHSLAVEAKNNGDKEKQHLFITISHATTSAADTLEAAAIRQEPTP